MRTRWMVLVGSGIALMVSYSPAIQQTFGIYLKPIAESFGWSRTTVSLVYSLTPLVAAPLMIVVGGLIDSFGNRPIILAQAFGLPVLLLLYSFLQPSTAMFVLVVCFGALVNSASTPASINSVLMQWFDRDLGMAMGLSMAALGIGNFILSVLAALWVHEWGWRGAFRAEAALIGVIGIANALLLIRDNPAILQARRQVARAEIDGLDTRTVLTMPLFWRLAGCFLLMGLMFAGVSVHFVALMTDRGVSMQLAASCFGLMGLAQIVGRMIGAAVADRVSVDRFATLMYLLAPLAFGLLSVGASASLYLAPIFLGIAAGVEVHAMGLIVRRWFGLRSAARIFSMCFTAFVVGSALGPLLMALAFDRFGAYRAPLTGFTILSLCVAWVFSGIGKYPQLTPRPAA